MTPATSGLRDRGVGGPQEVVAAADVIVDGTRAAARRLVTLAGALEREA